ncbi:MAG: exodeoxyribonuclease VII large subunit [Pseudomonadota bacterium]
MPAPEKQTPLTVSQLNRRARLTIEQEFTQVWVIGELSNFARPRSGHWYFTLKDEQAQVRCAMFANRNRAVQLQPRDGHLVMIRGRVSLYEGRGEFQVVADHMEAAGEGALRQAFEQLKVKLASAGLFASERKQPLPAIPRHVVVITSPTGAALRDILAVWRRRFPALQVTLIPTLVQGSSAEADIIRALEWAGRVAPDAVLLSRGGGSLEDLWAFNLEPVARAIAACPVPVVAGIGHEIDVTIADYVADVRAPTPSAAAEVLVPDAMELQQTLRSVQRRLRQLWQQQAKLQHLRIARLRAQLVTPAHAVNQANQKMDELNHRLLRALQGQLRELHTHRALLQNRLQHNGPGRQLQMARSQAQQLRQRLHQSMQLNLQHDQTRLSSLARMLQSVSPLPTLARGYAVVRNTERQVLAGVEQIATGERVTTQLHNGTFISEVISVAPGQPFISDPVDGQSSG